MKRLLVFWLLLAASATALPVKIVVNASERGAAIMIRISDADRYAKEATATLNGKPLLIVHNTWTELGSDTQYEVTLTSARYDIHAESVHGLSKWYGDLPNQVVQDGAVYTVEVSQRQPYLPVVLPLAGAVVAVPLGVWIWVLRKRPVVVQTAAPAPLLMGKLGELQTGSQIGPYRVAGLIARGGMGAVYEVEDSYGDHHAMKIPDWKLQEGEHRKRFVREIELCLQVPKHPNIVHLQDYCLGDAVTPMYLVFQLVSATSLKHIVEQQNVLPTTEALRFARGVLAGLGHAHACGVVHRDVKPGNVLVDEWGTPQVTDFGIARHIDLETITQTHEAVGTPAYMAPEQLRSHRVDHRVDIYAVGVMLYRMLTGRMPYESTDHYELVYKKAAEDPPPPSQFNATLSPAVDALVMRALARTPEARFQTCDEMIAALDTVR